MNFNLKWYEWIGVILLCIFKYPVVYPALWMWFKRWPLIIVGALLGYVLAYFVPFTFVWAMP